MGVAELKQAHITAFCAYHGCHLLGQNQAAGGPFFLKQKKIVVPPFHTYMKIAQIIALAI